MEYRKVSRKQAENNGRKVVIIWAEKYATKVARHYKEYAGKVARN